ncbi:hypothetical protein BC936DRAFT_141740, partial [Jimgerdemannia flammicorona]
SAIEENAVNRTFPDIVAGKQDVTTFYYTWHYRRSLQCNLKSYGKGYELMLQAMYKITHIDCEQLAFLIQSNFFSSMRYELLISILKMGKQCQIMILSSALANFSTSTSFHVSTSSITTSMATSSLTSTGRPFKTHSPSLVLMFMLVEYELLKSSRRIPEKLKLKGNALSSMLQ